MCLHVYVYICTCMYIYMYVHVHSHYDWSKLINISAITFPRNHDDFAKWSEDLAPKNDSPEAAKTLEKTAQNSRQ